MKARLDDLIQKASQAQPPTKQSRSVWKPYLPIIRILMEERAYTLRSAVDWLIGQGEIPRCRQTTAYCALQQILGRREAKKQRQQARLQGLIPAPLPLPTPAPPLVTPPLVKERAQAKGRPSKRLKSVPLTHTEPSTTAPTPAV